MIALIFAAFALASAELSPGDQGPEVSLEGIQCEQIVMKGSDARKPLEELHVKAKAQEFTIVRTAKDYMHGADKKYFLKVAAQAEAALGKHHDAILKEPDLRKIDIPHHIAILRAISEFDFKKPKWSFLKIDEAVKLAHDPWEYANCEDEED